MPNVLLTGCTPEPLMSYLKALGAFRLVAEQADESATLSWSGGQPQLCSKLERDGLLAFFLNDYRPTPILAPWNGGSGFYGGGSEPLLAIASSTATRLAHYRETVSRIRTFAPNEKPKDEQKESLLIRCRADLADEVVPWLDTCFVLGESGPSYFPLLGTGGNDGRLDFTNNFMQRLADVIPFDDAAPSDESAGWLASALWGDSLTALGKAAVGQFNPGGIGGANGTQGRFEADSRVNPWDYVLMIEGAMLFAGSVARRLNANSTSRAVFPFTVESVAVGYGSSAVSEETTDGSRAELWLPLWNFPTSFGEVQQLFAEGRAQVGKRQARNAVDFALAVSLLGVNRGVSAFARYGFLKRNGLAFLAAPLGRVPVKAKPSARLLDDQVLLEWLDRLRSACRDKERTPHRYQTALRQVDRAIFEFATRSDSNNESDRRALVNVLRALGRAEQTLARGLAFCKDKFIRPLQMLPAQWLDQANDHSPEFRLAASIAGIEATRSLPPIRSYLEEVEIKGSFANWQPHSVACVWSGRTLDENLAAVFRRRQIEASQAGANGKDEKRGVALHSRVSAELGDVVAFIEDDLDDGKLADLIWGLIGVNFAAAKYSSISREAEPRLPLAFALPRLLVGSRAFLAKDRYWWIDSDALSNANYDADVFNALAANRSNAVAECVDRAARRLMVGGLVPHGYRNRRRTGQSLEATSSTPPVRLLAAMLFPLSNTDLQSIANAVLYPPEEN